MQLLASVASEGLRQNKCGIGTNERRIAQKAIFRFTSRLVFKLFAPRPLVPQSRRQLFVVHAGESLRGTTSLIEQQIKTHPHDGCYFIFHGELLLFIELKTCNESGELAATLGATERRFVGLLCGPHATVNEHQPIVTATCSARASKELLRSGKRSSSTRSAFAASILSESESAFNGVDTLHKIYDRLIIRRVPNGMTGPQCEYRRALYAAIVAFLLGTPNREFITYAKSSLEAAQAAHAALVERRILDAAVSEASMAAFLSPGHCRRA